VEQAGAGITVTTAVSRRPGAGVNRWQAEGEDGFPQLRVSHAQRSKKILPDISILKDNHVCSFQEWVSAVAQSMSSFLA
jgi:hypothetical protein